MGKFSLENEIKNRLKGHEVHVDKRELWKALGIEEEEKDRKAIWFWWFGGLIGLLVIGAIWWPMSSEDTMPPISEKVVAKSIEDNISKTGNERPQGATSIEKMSKIIEESDSEIASKINGKTESEFESTNTRIVVKKEETMTESEISKTVIDPSETEENSLSVRDEASRLRTSDLSSKSESLGYLTHLSILPITSAALEHKRLRVILDKSPSVLIEPIKKTRKFELELFAGIAPIVRSLSALDRDMDQLVAARDSSESTLEHLSAGFSMKYLFGRGWYGKAGFTMNRWNEKFTYTFISDTLVEKVDVPDVIIIDLQGNSTTNYTEGEKITYTTEGWIRYNRLTQIDLPLTLGYERRMGRWSMFGEAAGIVNLQQVFRGYLHSLNGEIHKDPDIFKTRIGINFGVNAGIGYGITPRLRARISGQYYRSLGSVLNSSSEMNQRYTSIGGRVSIGYLF